MLEHAGGSQGGLCWSPEKLAPKSRSGIFWDVMLSTSQHRGVGKVCGIEVLNML